MRKLVLIAAVVCFAGVVPGPARAQVEIFGGYSYIRPPVTFTELPPVCPLGILPPCPPVTVSAHPNLNGWEVTGVYDAYHWIGIAADFSGHYGTVNGVNTHINTYLFGPQVRLGTRVSPFAHALFGVAHENLGGATDSAFAAAVGAGIDIGVAPFLSFRPIQLDYLVTRFGSSTQNQPRASAGLVLHF
jgi:hypothetical protein